MQNKTNPIEQLLASLESTLASGFFKDHEQETIELKDLSTKNDWGS